MTKHSKTNTSVSESLGLDAKIFNDEKERKKVAGERLFTQYRHKLQESNIPFIEIHGEIAQGPISSWYGEYMAIYKALFYTQSHTSLKIEILTDHKASADQFTTITRSNLKQLLSKIKMTGFPIWSAISFLERKRARNTAVTWVEAHIGNFGNSYADYLAGLYGTYKRSSTLPFSCPTDLKLHHVKTIIMYDNQATQEPTRKLIGTIQTVLKTVAGLETITQIGNPESNDWIFTRSVTNNFVHVTTNTGQRSLSYSRASNLKKLTGQSPGQLQLKRMHPGLFPDDLCRICGKETESNLHIMDMHVKPPKTKQENNHRQLQRITHQTLQPHETPTGMGSPGTRTHPMHLYITQRGRHLPSRPLPIPLQTIPSQKTP